MVADSWTRLNGANSTARGLRQIASLRTVKLTDRLAESKKTMDGHITFGGIYDAQTETAEAGSVQRDGSTAPLKNHSLIRKGDQYQCGTGEWREAPQTWWGHRYNKKHHTMRRPIREAQ